MGASRLVHLCVSNQALSRRAPSYSLLLPIGWVLRLRILRMFLQPGCLAPTSSCSLALPLSFVPLLRLMPTLASAQSRPTLRRSYGLLIYENLEPGVETQFAHDWAVSVGFEQLSQAKARLSRSACLRHGIQIIRVSLPTRQ